MNETEHKRLFDLSQELRNKIIKDDEELISFAGCKCNCSEGIMVFDSETRTPLFIISENTTENTDELYNKLVRARNKLNRRISTLKKAKPKSNREEVGLSEEEENHLLEKTDTYFDGFFSGQKQAKK